jgi:hypothetical protein
MHECPYVLQAGWIGINPLGGVICWSAAGYVLGLGFGQGNNFVGRQGDFCQSLFHWIY